jgi:hypothetical protein
MFRGGDVCGARVLCCLPVTHFRRHGPWAAFAAKGRAAANKNSAGITAFYACPTPWLLHFAMVSVLCIMNCVYSMVHMSLVASVLLDKKMHIQFLTMKQYGLIYDFIYMLAAIQIAATICWKQGSETISVDPRRAKVVKGLTC